MTARAAVGLGSNLGDRAGHLTAAIDALAAEVGRVVGVSSLYRTAPLGGVPQSEYLNAVAVVDTDLEPRQVLDRLLAVERSRGRERRERWGPRTLDLDLLLYGDRVIDEPGLTVPHPAMSTRRFVLDPLVEAWPDAVIPTQGPASSLLSRVADQDVQRWAPPRCPVQVSRTSAGPLQPPYWIPDTGYRIPPTAVSPTIPAVTPNLHVVDHPLVQHKLTLMRDRNTASADFRRLLREISALMGYEVTRDLPTTLADIETPLAPMQAPVIAGLKPVVVSILRAGGGILEGILDVLPVARVGHIGLYRDPETLEAVEYYFKMPDRIGERVVVLVDPMLATGHSAVAAVDRVKALGPGDVRFVCLLAAPEGIATFHQAHPDVPIWTAAVDSHLNDHGYIVPGLGDAGDRIFGTK